MRLDDMKLLLRVADSGSMTLAARQANLTSAAVSAAVKRAESSMGVRIFERTTRSVRPTEDGLLVLEACQDLLSRWQQTLEAVQGPSAELVGTVHVSAPADTTYQLLAPAVVEVSERHPQLQIVVHSSDVVSHLHREAIDMAIRYGPLEDSSLSSRKLAEAPGVLVAAPSYLESYGQPWTASELRKHRKIALQRANAPSTTWRLEGPEEAREVPLEGSLCADGHLVRRWAVEGRGIAMKSLFDVIEDLEEGRLVRVMPDLTVGLVPIHAVFPSRRYMPVRVRVIAEAVSSLFQARAHRCAAYLER